MPADLTPAAEMAAHLQIPFPGASDDYRKARQALLTEEIEFRRHATRLTEQRRALPPGPVVEKDYRFKDENGEDVGLLDLFGDKDTLVAYFWMYGPQRERPCPMCTNWLGSVNGNADDVKQRVALKILGRSPVERQNAFELMRDQAAEHYERHIGKPWLPRSGSKVNHRNLTSAMIDSRDFLMAKKRDEQEVLLPPGPKIVVTGGLDFNDHRLIWAKLDQVHEKHPDMVLMHGKSPKGAEKIASLWANNRNVPQIGFAPDWTKHGRAAPFKRNDQMLEIVPKGVMHFPGTGIQDNLADKAKKLGIPVWRFGGA